MVLTCFLALGLGLAFPGLRAPFILDDQIRIVENLDIRSLKDLPKKLIYPYGPYPVYTRNDPSRPLVSLTYALNYRIGKLDPLGYHLFDVLAHVGTAFLVFLYLQVIFSRMGLDGGRILAAFPAAYFLCHPVMFGTVMYAYGRSDTLSAFLIVLTLVLYARAHSPGSFGSRLAPFCFVLVLLTKESAVVIPFVLLAQDILVGVDHESGRERSRLRRWLPYFAIAALYVLGRWAYFGGIGDLVGGKNAWSRWAYTSVQPFAIVQYIRMLFVPTGLAIDHFIQPSTLTVDDKILGVLTLAGIGAALWRWDRTGTPVGRCALFFGILFFALLAPTSSFFPTVDALVERRLYPAGMAVFSLSALLISKVLRNSGPTRHVFRVAMILPLAAFSMVTVQRNRMINDPAEVWKDVLKTYPDSPRALNNFAVLLQVRGKVDDAFDLYERLIAFNPNDYIAHMNLARIHENPSSAHFDRAKSRSHYEIAIQIEPAFADGHYNFGRLLHLEGDVEAAEREYLRVLEINPAYVQAHNNLGLLYFHQGRTKEAENRIRWAIELDPTYAPGQANWEMIHRPEPGPRAP